jgi:uncharacterized protein involved in exopolysaccharide biosynthesis
VSAEFWAIVGVGAALLGVVLPLMVGLFASLRSDVRNEIAELRSEIRDLRAELAGLRDRVAALEGAFEEMRRWSQQVLGAVLGHPAA